MYSFYISVISTVPWRFVLINDHSHWSMMIPPNPRQFRLHSSTVSPTDLRQFLLIHKNSHWSTTIPADPWQLPLIHWFMTIIHWSMTICHWPMTISSDWWRLPLIHDDSRTFMMSFIEYFCFINPTFITYFGVKFITFRGIFRIKSHFLSIIILPLLFLFFLSWAMHHISALIDSTWPPSSTSLVSLLTSGFIEFTCSCVH